MPYQLAAGLKAAHHFPWYKCSKSWFTTLLGLSDSNFTIPETIILALVTTPDACIPNLGSIQILVINRPASSNTKHGSAQPGVQSPDSACSEFLQQETLVPSPLVLQSEDQPRDKGSGGCATPYVDSTCNNNPADEKSAVKDDYWKWDVGRQRFVHQDEQTGEEILCPEWFD